MKKPVQIIKVSNNEIGEEKLQTVNSRELWQELGVQKDYSDWIKTQIETLDLEENLDFVKLPLKGESKNTLGRGGDRKSIDYIITIDAAKHIAMASRTPKGKEVRKYFIEMEKYARFVLEQKIESANILHFVKNQQFYIEKRQEVTLEVISDFIEFGENTVNNLRNLINAELDSLLILNKAYVDSMEDPAIQRMFMSVVKSIEYKRDNLLQLIQEKVLAVNKHNKQVYQFENKLKELDKDFQTVVENMDVDDAS